MATWHYPEDKASTAFNDDTTSSGWQPQNFCYGAPVVLPAGDVTQLGIFGDSNGSAGVGLKVGLYTSGGTLVVQGSMTLPTSSTKAWHSVDVTDTEIAAGTYYVMGSGSTNQLRYGFDLTGNGNFVSQNYAASMAGFVTIGGPEVAQQYGVRAELEEGGGGSSVTPGTLALTLTTFAPTVTVSNHQSVTPGALALTLSAFAPTVTASNHQVVTPGTASLSLSLFAPTVTVTNGLTLIPSTASLVLSPFAPTVTVTQHQLVIPGTATLSLTLFAPTVTASGGQTAVPGTAALSLATFAPIVTATNHQVVIPALATLSLSLFAPTITASNHQTVTPGLASLTLSLFAPTVSLSNQQVVIPGTAALTLSTFAPAVTFTGHQLIIPGTATLVLTGLPPAVQAGLPLQQMVFVSVHVGVMSSQTVHVCPESARTIEV